MVSGLALDPMDLSLRIQSRIDMQLVKDESMKVQIPSLRPTLIEQGVNLSGS